MDDKLQGAFDCMFGIPAKEDASEDYLAGYGRQYEYEQQEDAKSGSQEII